MDDVAMLRAYYGAYADYFGVDADEVDPAEFDAVDRATLAGLRAAIAMETGTAIDAQRRGPKGESAGLARGIAQTLSGYVGRK